MNLANAKEIRLIHFILFTKNNFDKREILEEERVKESIFFIRDKEKILIDIINFRDS